MQSETTEETSMTSAIRETTTEETSTISDSSQKVMIMQKEATEGPNSEISTTKEDSTMMKGKDSQN